MGKRENGKDEREGIGKNGKLSVEEGARKKGIGAGVRDIGRKVERDEG